MAPGPAPQSSPPVAAPAGAAALVFLLHGVGALCLESVWVKAEVALFGSVPAAPGSVLLACFLGMALGSWRWRGAGAGALVSARFALAAAGALALSLLLPALLLHGIPLLGPAAAATLLRDPVLWATAFVAILPAATVLGAFFPALGGGAGGRSFVALYGTEAAGAAVGVGLGTFLLPPAIGYGATGALGAAAILLALVIARRLPQGEAAASRASGRAPAEGRLLFLAFASGLLTLVLEALWIRLVSLASDDSVYAFGSVSLLAILVTAAASLAVALLPERLARSPRLLAAVPPLAVAGGVAAGAIWVALTHGLAIRLVTAALGFAGAFRLAAPLVVVGSLPASFLLPLVLRAAARAEGEGSLTGPLVAANCAGAAAGVALASAILLPHAGIWLTLVATLAAYALLPAALPGGGARWAAAGAGAALLAIANPLRYPVVTPSDPFGGPSGRVVSAREGSRGIVSVIDYPGRALSLWLNNTYLLEAFSGDSGATRRMGLLATALHPRARRLAMIGVGTGITASGFLDTPLEEIDLFELLPEVADAAATSFARFNGNALADPRVRLLIDDGRHAIAMSGGGYDVVCVDLVTPWNEGASALYTAEHFRAVRSRLARGGILVVWLPAFQLERGELLLIARTLAEVFPSVSLWQLGATSCSPAVALVGASTPLDSAEIAGGTGRPPPAGVATDTVRLHESGVLLHYVGPVDPGGPLLAGVPINTLDRPRLEFLAARPGRALLRGKPYLDFLESFFALPGNPGGRIFTLYDGERDSWRRTGRDMNLYAWHLEQGEAGAARELERRIAALPAFRLAESPGGGAPPRP
jgi:spermidine synthase